MKKRIQRLAVFVLLAATLGACAVGPRFDTTRTDRALTPQRAAAQGDAMRGKRVLWGGLIIASTNLRRSTRLEVLAFPLGRDQQPDTDARPLGRFLLIQPGYLETADYAPGRLLTVAGHLIATQRGRVGESAYIYPVLVADGLYLWPKDERSTEPQIHFGIGVILHN